jgi:hypothetical protein
MTKVHEPYSKDLSGRLYADNTVNEFQFKQATVCKRCGKGKKQP